MSLQWKWWRYNDETILDHTLYTLWFPVTSRNYWKIKLCWCRWYVGSILDDMRNAGGGLLQWLQLVKAFPCGSDNRCCEWWCNMPWQVSQKQETTFSFQLFSLSPLPTLVFCSFSFGVSVCKISERTKQFFLPAVCCRASLAQTTIFLHSERCDVFTWLAGRQSSPRRQNGCSQLFPAQH